MNRVRLCSIIVAVAFIWYGIMQSARALSSLLLIGIGIVVYRVWKAGGFLYFLVTYGSGWIEVWSALIVGAGLFLLFVALRD